MRGEKGEKIKRSTFDRLRKTWPIQEMREMPLPENHAHIPSNSPDPLPIPAHCLWGTRSKGRRKITRSVKIDTDQDSSIRYPMIFRRMRPLQSLISDLDHPHFTRGAEELRRQW